MTPVIFQRRSQIAVSGSGSAPGFAPPDIASIDFESGITSGWSFEGGAGQEIIVTDGTAPSASHSLSLNWVSGAEMTAGIQARYDALATSGPVYHRFYYKIPAGFTTSGIKKITRFQGIGGNGIYGTLIWQSDRFDWAWDGDSLSHLWPTTPSSLAGTGWHCFEVMNDLSVNPWHATCWLDGVVQIDGNPTPGFGTTPGGPIGVSAFCGTFNTPAANGIEFIDNCAVSTTRIGP